MYKMVIKRANKACKYFPCHKGLEDCTFCYCPFYPCLNKKRGNYVHPTLSTAKRKSGVHSEKFGRIWSCKKCNWIHKKKNVDKFFTLIRNEKQLSFKDTQQIKADKTGVIILAHGSRLRKANNILLKIVEMVKTELQLKDIIPAYLQLCEPDLSASIKVLIAKGSKTIIIVPFFLFSGNHVMRDIPLILKKEKEKYPEINFICTKNLGDNMKIGDIVINRIKEAIKNVCNY